MNYEEANDPSEARWMRKLMRDAFQLLLKKVRAGEFITPAFFHKCTIPHSYHCFKRYHFRPNPFDQYMRKHKVPLRAPTASQLHKVTLAALRKCNAGFQPAIVPSRDSVIPGLTRDPDIFTSKLSASSVSSVVNSPRHSAAARQREESNFRSPSEFSFSSVSKNVRSFRASADTPSREIHSQPSNCHPGLRAGIQFATSLKLKTNNSKLNKPLHALHDLHGKNQKLSSKPSVFSVAKHTFVKSNPKLDNYKTFFAKVPDT